MAIASNYPAIRPSLNLDFANAKALDPRITFSRASAATYYDGKTVAKAEENLFTNSENISAWSPTRATVTGNVGIAPNGSTTAGLIKENTTVNNSHAFRGAIVSLSSGVAYTFSCYFKTAGRAWVMLLEYITGQASEKKAYFDIVNGVVGTTTAGVSAAIYPVGDGWFRCVMSFTASAGSNVGVVAYIANADNSFIYTGDGVSGVYAWGAQLEQRSQATAYTPTTTQPITNYIPVLQTAPAGVPRFDHNPVTGESMGLLVEEQRTNLLTYSEQFDNTSRWSKTRLSVLADQIAAPDGGLTADKLVPSATSNIQFLHGGPYVIPSGTTTFSIYCKKGEYKWLGVNAAYSGGSVLVEAVLDLENATTSPGFVSAGGSQVSSVTPLANGWMRFVVAFTGPAGSAGGLSITTSSNKPYNFLNTSSTGDGYSGIYIWGAQLEAGAFPTSYIKTEASQVTRAADSAQMTGANFSSWYRQDEGTIAVESILRSVIGTDAYVATISGGNIDNTIRLGHLTNGNARRLNVRANAVNTVALDIFPASVSDVVYKQSASYKVNDFATSSNGSNVAKTAAGAIPYNLDKLVIGASALYVRRIAYYPKRLTDAQLQALTA